MSERSWMALLAGGACLAAGALLATVLRLSASADGSSGSTASESTASSAASPTPAAVSALDRAVLEELTRELRALREVLATERDAVAVAGELDSRQSFQALRDELGLVLAQLQRQATGSTGSSASTLDTSSRGPLRASLFLRSAQDGGDEQRTQSHLLWSYQRVLDAYGTPDHVDASAGRMEWTYCDPDGKRQTCLLFTDGYVVHVYECDLD